MLYIMLKPVSGTCNMECDYCFYKDEAAKRQAYDYGIMTEQTLEQVIKKALCFADDGCVFAYQGGEPTLAGLHFFKKSISLQKKYNKNGIFIQNVIQTNGYALTEKWCAFFHKHHFLVGISLDGTKAAHDRFRKTASGADTYLSIMHTIDLLKKYQVEFNILTVVHKTTAAKITRIYENYKRNGFLYQQYIACAEPLGESVQNNVYSLSAEEYGKFLCRLFELWLTDLQNGHRIFIRQFDNWLNILNGFMPEACEQRGVCGIQTIIEADGSAYPCDFYVLDSYCIGNINNDDMDVIFQNRKKIAFIENNYNHSEECLHCNYFHLCRGGCSRYRINGQNIYCSGYKRFFDQHYDTLSKLAKRTMFDP